MKIIITYYFYLSYQLQFPVSLVGLFIMLIPKWCHLNRAVVLVDLNAKLATGGEVVRLWQVTLQAVVLHGVHVVLHANQPALVLVTLVLVAGPDLLEVRNDVISTEQKKMKLE